MIAFLRAVASFIRYTAGRRGQLWWLLVAGGSMEETEGKMAMAGGQEEAGVRLKLERSIYDVCKRSPEGSDFLVSAFVQAMHSYRRSSGMSYSGFC